MKGQYSSTFDLIVSDPKLVGELLKLALPPQILKEYDLDKLTLEEGTFGNWQ